MPNMLKSRSFPSIAFRHKDDEKPRGRYGTRLALPNIAIVYMHCSQCKKQLFPRTRKNIALQYIACGNAYADHYDAPVVYVLHIAGGKHLSLLLLEVYNTRITWVRRVASLYRNIPSLHSVNVHKPYNSISRHQRLWGNARARTWHASLSLSLSTSFAWSIWGQVALQVVVHCFAVYPGSVYLLFYIIPAVIYCLAAVAHNVSRNVSFNAGQFTLSLSLEARSSKGNFFYSHFFSSLIKKGVDHCHSTRLFVLSGDALQNKSATYAAHLRGEFAVWSEEGRRSFSWWSIIL